MITTKGVQTAFNLWMYLSPPSSREAQSKTSDRGSSEMCVLFEDGEFLEQLLDESSPHIGPNTNVRRVAA